MEFKKTLANCITIAVCVIALCITSVIGVGKIGDAKVAVAEKSGSAVSANGDADVVDPGTGDVVDPGTGDVVDPNGDVVDPSAEDPTGTEEPGTADNNGGATSNGGSSSGGNTTTTTNKGGSTNTTSSAPKTTAQIISYYNTATAKVVDSKAGFNKVRYTDNEKMDAGAVMKSFKSLIYKFMGIGSDNKYVQAVTKGDWGDRTYMMKSKLTASDVTSASCATSGSNYVITLKLKNGSSVGNKSQPSNAPNTSLDKCGINVGNKDKSYFDHKTGAVVYDAIAGTYSSADIKESYSNATVKATIDSKTGKMVGLTVQWNISMSIDLGIAGSGTATGTSHVVYSNFKF